jgi:hypothetical protein
MQYAIDHDTQPCDPAYTCECMCLLLFPSVCLFIQCLRGKLLYYMSTHTANCTLVYSLGTQYSSFVYTTSEGIFSRF